MSQRWSTVSFIHWRVDAALVAPYMPSGCVPDIVDGSAWVGLIGFQMEDSAFFGGPRIPWLGNFPEVNVRLYSVDKFGRRGVVFLSLEATHLLPVATARLAFGLKYQWASMEIQHHLQSVRYVSRRHGRRSARSSFEVTPGTEPHANALLNADPVAIELSARWAFHERHLGRTIYCQNTHEPWPLQTATLDYLDDRLLAAAGFPDLAHQTPESVMFAQAVNTQFGVPQILR